MYFSTVNTTCTNSQIPNECYVTNGIWSGGYLVILCQSNFSYHDVKPIKKQYGRYSVCLFLGYITV